MPCFNRLLDQFQVGTKIKYYLQKVSISPTPTPTQVQSPPLSTSSAWVVHSFFFSWWTFMYNNHPMSIVYILGLRFGFIYSVDLTNVWWYEFINLVSCPVICGASQVVTVVKNPPANTGDITDMGLMPGLGRSPAGERGNLLQCSCLENPTDSLVGYSW